MSLQAYQQAATRAESPRETEYRLFAQVTLALMEAAKADPERLPARDRRARLEPPRLDGAGQRLREPGQPAAGAAARLDHLAGHLGRPAHQRGDPPPGRHRAADRRQPPDHAGPGAPRSPPRLPRPPDRSAFTDPRQGRGREVLRAGRKRAGDDICRAPGKSCPAAAELGRSCRARTWLTDQ